MEYAKKLGIPFGISESAFSLKDLNNNYQKYLMLLSQYNI